MREGATLKLDSGEELRVDIERDEIVVRRSAADAGPPTDRLAVLDNIIATTVPHAAGMGESPRGVAPLGALRTGYGEFHVTGHTIG